MLFVHMDTHTRFTLGTKLPPLHSRVISLLQQLPFDANNCVCGMDNLYISPNFSKVELNKSGKRVMIHGVCRPIQGNPKCIVQDAVEKKEYILRDKKR